MRFTKAMTQLTHLSGRSHESNAVPRTARGRRLDAKALPGDARRHNRTLVLQTLFRSGPLSRADVARATKLTKVTVSDLVAALITDGLVVEIGQQETTGPGKPAVLLDLARITHTVISLDLRDHRLFRGAVLDLDGTIVARAERALDDATGEAALELTTALALELATAAGTARVIGVGVGTPGVVDHEGVVRTAPNLGWDNLPLQTILEERLDLPVVVANDANAAVLAEHDFADASGDLMLIMIGHGVGSGLIVGGTPVTGSRFAAGEIGQVMVGTDLGLDSPYDRSQVLEHWLSVPSLTAALANADDDARERILREAGQRLGVALAPVVGALNLSEVVLAGPEELLTGTLADATRDIIARRTMPDSHSDLVIRTSAHGDDLVLRGATAIVLHTQLGLT